MIKKCILSAFFSRALRRGNFLIFRVLIFFFQFFPVTLRHFLSGLANYTGRWTYSPPCTHPHGIRSAGRPNPAYGNNLRRLRRKLGWASERKEIRSRKKEMEEGGKITVRTKKRRKGRKRKMSRKKWWKKLRREVKNVEILSTNSLHWRAPKTATSRRRSCGFDGFLTATLPSRRAVPFNSTSASSPSPPRSIAPCPLHFFPPHTREVIFLEAKPTKYNLHIHDDSFVRS